VTSLDMTIANAAVDIGRATAEFDGFASRHDLPAPVKRRVGVALDEILSNIMNYAYNDRSDHSIGVNVLLEEERLTITVIDDGMPFNPFDRESPDVDQRIEERSSGGLGIYLVSQMMDNVSWERRGDRNVVVMHTRTDRLDDELNGTLDSKETQ